MATTKKKQKKKKRTPSQQRAKASVEAILQATTYILLRDGWARLTTNKIAERAGVNIASLYQYFPNKEAIVLELQRRHVVEARAAARAASVDAAGAAAGGGVDWHQRLRAGITAALAYHAVAPELHRVLTDELPQRARQRSDIDDPGARLDYWRAALPLLHDRPDPGLVLWVIDTALHALVHRAAADRPRDLANPLLVDELARLFGGYLGLGDDRADRADELSAAGRPRRGTRPAAAATTTAAETRARPAGFPRRAR